MKSRTYPITPVPAARARTVRDKRGQVHTYTPKKYAAFLADCRKLKMRLPDAVGIVFNMPMPKSWPKKKRDFMHGRAHQVKPDLDNLTKAVMDAARADDQRIHRIVATKIWANDGCIHIYDMDGWQ